MKTLAKKLTEEKGLSGQKLSYATRITPTNVSLYLRGKATPWPGHAKRIAEALGYEGDPMELFKEVNND